MSVFLYEPFYDVDRLFNEAFGFRGQRRNTDNVDGAVRSFKPRMDLHEDSEKNLVTATFELPGVNKQDIQIDLAHGGRLTISAETKQDTERNEDGYAVRERRFGRFARTLNVPQGTKEGDIHASMDNGLLTVTFPKTSAEQAPKKISIA